MYKIWDKSHPYYYWVKYNLYKPVRNWLCHYGYGEHLCEEDHVKRRREWIMSLKEMKK
jgi:hypothetical protein